MKEALAAMTKLLEKTGLPVYAEGQVPPEAVPPLVTFNWTPVPYPDKGTCAVTAYFPEENGHDCRAGFAVRLNVAVPRAGALEKAGDGWLWVRRGTAEQADDNGTPVLRAKLGVLWQKE